MQLQYVIMETHKVIVYYIKTYIYIYICLFLFYSFLLSEGPCLLFLKISFVFSLIGVGLLVTSVINCPSSGILLMDKEIMIDRLP